MANEQAQTANPVASSPAAGEPIDPSEFEWVGPNVKEMETISRPSISFWKDAFRRLRKSRVAIVCLVILALLVLGAVFLPMVSPFDFSRQNVAFSNQPPMWVDNETSQPHLFGTDTLGRDIWVRIWMGARVSLTVAVAVALIDCLIGIVYGGVSGYFGGMVDNVMMRIVEIISGIPYLIIVMLLMVVLPRGIGTIIIAYSITGWTGMARLVRGQVLALRHQEFLIAAESMGARPARIIARHLAPNLLSLIVVNVTLDIPNVIFTEAFLSMLGLGIAPPQSSWGIMANDGIAVFQVYPMQLVYPAVFISITMLAFNLLGDQMRDAFDPKLRR
ncbi:MAG TPA: diguanylate cyclase [Ruminococcaceae bacterium]|nr:diguanylate cyclase [Oscillospiraceae bacterium]